METISFNAKNTAKCNQATESVTAYILSLLNLVNMQVSFPAKGDVITEPVNLAQHNPTSRPANTLINLTPTYADPPIIPFSQLDIDVTITPPFPITDGDDPSTYAASAINHASPAV
jgi:hypothetical protein